MVDYSQNMHSQVQPQQMSQQNQQGPLPASVNTQNPFDMLNLTGGGSNQPIAYAGGMTEVLLSDAEVPKTFKERFWWVFSRDNTLGFLDKERKNLKLLENDILKIDVLSTMPYYDYTFSEELNFSLSRVALIGKLDRALGIDGRANVKNERILLSSSLTEQRQVSEHGGAEGAASTGFFKRLLGRRA